MLKAENTALLQQNYPTSNNCNIEIWTKFIFIASFALVTATYDRTIGEVANDENLDLLAKKIMQEIALLAKALKVKLPSDIVEASFSKANQFPLETKTSFSALRIEGILAVWSSGADKAFTRHLNQCGFQTETVALPAHKAGKSVRHIIWVARKP